MKKTRDSSYDEKHTIILVCISFHTHATIEVFGHNTGGRVVGLIERDNWFQNLLCEIFHKTDPFL